MTAVDIEASAPVLPFTTVPLCFEWRPSEAPPSLAAPRRSDGIVIVSSARDRVTLLHQYIIFYVSAKSWNFSNTREVCDTLILMVISLQLVSCSPLLHAYMSLLCMHTHMYPMYARLCFLVTGGVGGECVVLQWCRPSAQWCQAAARQQLGGNGRSDQ